MNEDPPDKSKQIVVRASQTVEEVRRLPRPVRTQLGALDELLVIAEAMCRVSEVLVADDDGASLFDRLRVALEEIGDDFESFGPQIAASMATMDTESLERFLARHRRPDFVAYLHRLVGEAAFRRLQGALSEDADLVVTAAHRVAAHAMPYLVALEDLAELLTEEQISQIMDFNPAGGFLIEMTVALLDGLGAAVEKVSLPDRLVRLSRLRAESMTARDLSLLTEELRSRISGQSNELIHDVSSVLDRKLKGAKQALVFSVDSVSQAATSLTEFIDRLLREAYPEQQVLEWIQENRPDDKRMTVLPSRGGKERPTKFAQALCVLHAARPIAQESPFHDLAATSIVVIRTRLQRLKHADQGTAEEQAEVEALAQSIEAFIHVGCRLAWATLPSEALLELKHRLGPKRDLVSPPESRLA